MKDLLKPPFFLSLLPKRLANAIGVILQNHSGITEVRIRNGLPVVLMQNQTAFFAGENGTLLTAPKGALYVTAAETDAVFKSLCHYSVYSFQESLRSCFVTLPDGSRTGLSLRAVIKDEKVYSVKDVFSFNFRIASSFEGIAEEALDELTFQGLSSTFIIGAPGSGKTTFLRDFCRALSTAYTGRYYKCVIIDERGEIAALNGAGTSFDIGVNTDVLSFFPKKVGISCAVRTLSPDYVFIDEIASVSEAKGVLEGMNSGVHFVMTLHAADLEEAQRKDIFQLLSEQGNIHNIVALSEDFQAKVLRI